MCSEQATNERLTLLKLVICLYECISLLSHHLCQTVTHRIDDIDVNAEEIVLKVIRSVRVINVDFKVINKSEQSGQSRSSMWLKQSMMSELNIH